MSVDTASKASSWTPPDFPVDDWNIRNKVLIIWSEICGASSGVTFLNTLCKRCKKLQVSKLTDSQHLTPTFFFILFHFISIYTHKVISSLSIKKHYSFISLMHVINVISVINRSAINLSFPRNTIFNNYEIATFLT